MEKDLRVDAIEMELMDKVVVESLGNRLYYNLQDLSNMTSEQVLKLIGMTDVDIMSQASQNERWSNEYAAAALIKYLLKEKQNGANKGSK